MVDLSLARELGRRESGLAVCITIRDDGAPRASVVNAGVVASELTGQPAVGFVSKGDARKLRDLRTRPSASVVFRSGWDWIAVEGTATIIGPDDNAEGLDDEAVLHVVRRVYAAAVGGLPEEWAHLDPSFVEERHTAVLLRPSRTYPTPA